MQLKADMIALMMSACTASIMDVYYFSGAGSSCSNISKSYNIAIAREKLPSSSSVCYESCQTLPASAKNPATTYKTSGSAKNSTDPFDLPNPYVAYAGTSVYNGTDCNFANF